MKKLGLVAAAVLAAFTFVGCSGKKIIIRFNQYYVPGF